MIYLFLLIGAICAWTVSTLGAGGSAMLMAPIILVLVGAHALPQILSINNLISLPYRLALFARYTDWHIVKWASPGVIIGAFLGAYTFTIANTEIILILLGVFLIIYSLRDLISKNALTFKVKNWYFFPASIFAAFFSGLLGSVGPILNVLYLQKDISKESILGTKSFNNVINNGVKLSTYTYFGSMNSEILTYGILAGLGGIAGITIGKKLLNKMSYTQFKKIVLFLMFISGVIIIAKGTGFWFI